MNRRLRALARLARIRSRASRRARQSDRIRAKAWADGLDLQGVPDDRLRWATSELYRRHGLGADHYSRRGVTRALAAILGLPDPDPDPRGDDPEDLLDD